MSANFNFCKAILGGRLTADPELKTTASGISVASFTVAINRRARDGAEPETDFINCTAWRQTAEFISRFFHKGSSICVVGQIQTRSWTDKQGNKRYATDVVVDEATFVDSKQQDQAWVERGGDPTPPMPETANLEEIDPQEELPF